MSLKIEITPEQVEQLVRETITSTALGKSITDAIARVLNSGGHNNPIDEALKRVVSSVVSEVLERDYKTQVEQLVRAEIEKRVSADVIAKFSEAAINKIVRASEESRY